MFGEISKKNVRLINVLYFEYRHILVKDFEFCIAKFEQHLDENNIIIQGPLIVRYFDPEVEDDEAYMNFDVMIQLAVKMGVKEGFKFSKEEVIKEYLHMRVKAAEEDLLIGEDYVDLHLWENNMSRGDIFYEVYLDRESDIFTIDNFIEVKENETKTDRSLKLYTDIEVVFSDLIVLVCKNQKNENKEADILEFSETIENTNLITRGPMIVHNLGTNISEGEEVTIDYNIMIQVESFDENIELPPNFKYIEKIHRDDCIRVVFNGELEDVGIAFKKINVYSFENELSVGSEHFVVYADMHSDIKHIDIIQTLI